MMHITPVHRYAFFGILDGAFVAASILAAFALRFDGVIPARYEPALWSIAPLAAAVTIGFLALNGVYRASWSFMGLRDVGRVALSVALSTVFLGLFVQAFHGPGEFFHGFPRSIVLIQAPITFCALSGFRLSKRAYRTFLRQKGARAGTPTLLVGAGDAGEQLLKSILAQGSRASHEVVGFLDDDRLAHRTRIHGVQVLGPVDAMEEHIKRFHVETVILTVASATSPFVRDVVSRARDAGVKDVRIVPPLSEIVDGSVTIQSTREVSLEDLLGREKVMINPDDLRALIQGKRVLVTGGAGTIGSELCRQVARLAPERLVVCDVDESRLHDVCLELRRGRNAPRVEEALVDVRDREGLANLFRDHGFQIVFHAAAYKHVPMMEKYPVAALDVNVLGTANVAEVAESHHCERFVLISTDKAVEPSSIMGASKRLAELVLFADQAKDNGRKAMVRSAVRFGNVIGSRGSVIPTFKAQLQHGGPLTVTHPDMERFFMMTSEAVSLVLQAASLGEGGEVFVLDMGKPVKILDVARDFIRMSGHEPETEIPIVFTGLRPGEKLYEVLNYADEHLQPTRHQRIMRARARLDEDDKTRLLKNVQDLVTARDHARAVGFFSGRFPTIAEFAQVARDADGAASHAPGPDGA